VLEIAIVEELTREKQKYFGEHFVRFEGVLGRNRPNHLRIILAQRLNFLEMKHMGIPLGEKEP
jgi:hypothetical protein